MSTKEIALLHAQTRQFKRKLKEARSLILRAIQTDAAGYVALSGGKDSTVVHALVREIQPDIPAVWSDDEWWLPETMDYIQRLQRAALDVRQIRTNAWHTDWFTIQGDYDDLPDYARRQGWRLCYLGLRQEESSARRVHLRTMGPLFFAKVDGFWHCSPIHDWTWRDVWAFIHSTGTDYNHAYDRLDQMGIEPQNQRIGPLAVERVLGFGQLTILKRGWPDLYNRFCARYPEARTYS